MATALDVTLQVLAEDVTLGPIGARDAGLEKGLHYSVPALVVTATRDDSRAAMTGAQLGTLSQMATRHANKIETHADHSVLWGELLPEARAALAAAPGLALLMWGCVAGGTEYVVDAAAGAACPADWSHFAMTEPPQSMRTVITGPLTLVFVKCLAVFSMGHSWSVEFSMLRTITRLLLARWTGEAVTSKLGASKTTDAYDR
eukprot:3630756-Amphidinium_carterae.1